MDNLKAGHFLFDRFSFIAIVFRYTELEDLNCKLSPGAWNSCQ